MEIKDIKVLIVEDESIVALDIEGALRKIGIRTVVAAYNYDSALKNFSIYSPDLLIMDINLGENSPNGIETAIDINKIKSTPVIFLTAFNDDQTISEAIALEPLGYLNKPFKREDLKSIIHLASFKINKTTKNKEITSLGNGYFYDPQNEKLYLNNEYIKLNNKESLLLKTLFEANGKIVTFNELEFKIWNEKMVSGSTLRTLIYRLRNKLEHDFIETIQSVGCRINMEI